MRLPVRVGTGQCASGGDGLNRLIFAEQDWFIRLGLLGLGLPTRWARGPRPYEEVVSLTERDYFR